MATDGLKSLGGESDLIDGALTSSRSKEDGYHPEDEEEPRENLVAEEDDDDDEDDNSVLELGMGRTLSREDEDDIVDDDSPPSLEDLKAKAARQWEKEIGTVEVIDDPVRMYLREIGRVDLLKAPQERELARKFEAKRYVERLEDELESEDGTTPRARQLVAEMLRVIGDNENIIKAILVAKEIPFDGTLPDLMANPDVRNAIDGIFQDDLLDQVSAIYSELTDQDPPDRDELKDMIKQSSINTRLMPDDIFRAIEGRPTLPEVRDIAAQDNLDDLMPVSYTHLTLPTICSV